MDIESGITIPCNPCLEKANLKTHRISKYLNRASLREKLQIKYGN